jgi:very-short-patch-repair endonuclease
MFRDRSPKSAAGAVRRSRAQRREMSLPEVLVWQALRGGPGGIKFRRQHPTGEFSLDFYCGDARLAIEIDGEAHERGDRPLRDAIRDAWLDEAGIVTLRIPAAEVLRDLDAVIRAILHEARSRLPLHHQAAPGGPPPRAKLGED